MCLQNNNWATEYSKSENDNKFQFRQKKIKIFQTSNIIQ